MANHFNTLQRYSSRVDLPHPHDLQIAIKSVLNQWLARPKWKHGLTRYKYAALHAAACSYVRHGPPPDRWQRLGYRKAKKMRVRVQELMTYGDPAAAHPVPLSEKEARKMVYARKKKKVIKPTGR